MSLADGSAYEQDYKPSRELTIDEERAWHLYCLDTAGDMDVRDYWDALSPRVKAHYLNKVRVK